MVFDLDDTLLHSDLTISPFTEQVFRRLHRNGFRIVAASGRAQLSMKPYVDQLDCVDAYISCNGAEIWNGADHRLIRRLMFPAETAVEIARFAEEYGCYAQVYDGNCFYFNQYGLYAERYAAAARLTGVYAGKLSDFIHEPRNKILMMDDEARIAVMYRDALKRFGEKASVTCSKPFYLEFNPPDATKGKALRTVSGCFGMTPEQFIAFGDSLNDLSMLQEAGTAVTVSNGWKEIRDYCDCVCSSNDLDGPAHYLNERFPDREVLA